MASGVMVTVLMTGSSVADAFIILATENDVNYENM
jgi:hypothetical protein